MLTAARAVSCGSSTASGSQSSKGRTLCAPLRGQPRRRRESSCSFWAASQVARLLRILMLEYDRQGPQLHRKGSAAGLGAVSPATPVARRACACACMV